MFCPRALHVDPLPCVEDFQNLVSGHKSTQQNTLLTGRRVCRV